MNVQMFSNCEGDWEGLYVDGKLVYEGHSIPSHEFIRLLGGESVYDSDGKAGDYLDKFGGSCPSNWSEIDNVMNGDQ